MPSPSSPAHRARCATLSSPPSSRLRATMRSGGHVLTEFSLPSGPAEQCWETPSCSTFANHGSGLRPQCAGGPYFEGGARMLYLSLIRLQLHVARLSIPNSARGQSTLWPGDVHEHSTRPFRTNARWLARALCAPPAHGSWPLRTAPVFDRRCRKWRPSPRVHNAEALPDNDKVKRQTRCRSFGGGASFTSSSLGPRLSR